MLIVSDRKLSHRAWLVPWTIILSIFETIFVIEFSPDITFPCNGTRLGGLEHEPSLFCTWVLSCSDERVTGVTGYQKEAVNRRSISCIAYRGVVYKSWFELYTQLNLIIQNSMVLRNNSKKSKNARCWVKIRKLKEKVLRTSKSLWHIHCFQGISWLIYLVQLKFKFVYILYIPN